MDNTNRNRFFIAEGIDYDMDCYKTKRNLNTLVVGASGCGKSRCLVTPNLLACSGSYVVSDPKGVLYENYRDFMHQHGYRVRKVDFVRLEEGEGYNFFQGLRTEDEILSAAVVLQQSHTDRNRVKNDDFWDSCEKVALSGAIGSILETARLLDSPFSSIPVSLEYAKRTDLSFSDLIVKRVLLRRGNRYPRTIRGINNILDDLMEETMANRELRKSCVCHYAQHLAEQENRSYRFLSLRTELPPRVYQKLQALSEQCDLVCKKWGQAETIGELLRGADTVYEQALSIAVQSESLELWKKLREGFLLKFMDTVQTTLEQILSHNLFGQYALLSEARPECFGMRQLRRLQNMSAEKTLSNILISAQAPLSILDTAAVNGMMERAEKAPFDFASVGTEKTALFVCVSDSDRRMDAFANFFFSRALQELTLYADTQCRDHTLPIHVRFFFDDFASNVKLEEMPKAISSFRSRNISTCLIVQSEAQLEQYYGPDAQTIVANCDQYLFAGSQSLKDAEVISRKTNKPLEDILYLPVGQCIVFRRGDRPKFSRLIDHDRFLSWIGFEKSREERALPTLETVV